MSGEKTLFYSAKAAIMGAGNSCYVQEQGWNLYAAYCDDGGSGTTFDCPMFNQMIAYARAGKINLILCKDLSRLGRDYAADRQDLQWCPRESTWLAVCSRVVLQI